MIIKIFYVGIGGFVGAALRFFTGEMVKRFALFNGFPYGTFIVNITGCFLIGFLAGLADSRVDFSETARAMVFTGILGALTTFSTFSFETIELLQRGQTSAGLTNLLLQIMLGLGAVLGGLQLSRWI